MSVADNAQAIAEILQGCVDGKAAIAEAITSKGVATDPADSFDTMAVNVGLIENGGGEANVAFGTFSLDHDVTINSKSSYELPFTMPFKPTQVCVWIDRDSFLEIESPSNNHFTVMSAKKMPESMIPLHYTGSSTVQSVCKDSEGYSYYVYPHKQTNTASPNGYGVSNPSFVNYADWPYWQITEDNKFIIGSFSSSSAYLYPGLYHWCAIKADGTIFM